MAATLFRTFTVNWLDKRLQLSPENGGELVFPPLNKYECIPLKFFIVAQDVDQLTFGKLPLDNLSLVVTINDAYDDTTPLVQQTSWTKDLAEQSFYGELDLNTALFNAYMGTNAVMNPKMSIMLTEGTARSEIWQSVITVIGSITPPAYVSPDPLQRYLTADEIEAMFVKYINVAGRQLTLTSPGNVQQRILGVTDGGTPIDQIIPV